MNKTTKQLEKKVLPTPKEINIRLANKQCLYCSSIIPKKENYIGRYNSRFCSDSHRVMYNCKLKEEELNKKSPEEFIKEQLRNNNNNHKNNKINKIVGLKRVYYKGRIFSFDTLSSYFRPLALKDGDILEFNIKIKKRNKSHSPEEPI